LLPIERVDNVGNQSELLLEDLLDVANLLLNGAVDPFGCAFVLEIGVFGKLANLLLQCTLDFMNLAFDLIVRAGCSHGDCLLGTNPFTTDFTSVETSNDVLRKSLVSSRAACSVSSKYSPRWMLAVSD
jgi:hypothetical protein